MELEAQSQAKNTKGDRKKIQDQRPRELGGKRLSRGAGKIDSQYGRI